MRPFLNDMAVPKEFTKMLFFKCLDTMKENNCVVRCTASGQIVEIDAIELNTMLSHADTHVKGLRNVREKAAHYQSLAMLCENLHNYDQAVTQLRKALRLYCRCDRAEMTQHYKRDAKYCAEWIDRLSVLAFDEGTRPHMLRDVTKYYEVMYWVSMEDADYEQYCDEGRVPRIDYNAWRLIARQLCA